MRSRAYSIWLIAFISAACNTGNTDTVKVEETRAAPGTALATSYQTFSSLAEMAAASTDVIIGTVIAIEDGVFQPAPVLEDFRGTLGLRVVVEVEQTLLGSIDPGSVVAIPWAGYEIGEDGARRPLVTADDSAIPRPQIGDRDVWFLAAGTEPHEGYHGLVGADGRYRVPDNEVLQLRGNVFSGAFNEIAGRSLEELADTLSGIEGE